MSNKRKLQKKEAETTDYTMANLVDDAVESYGKRLEDAIAEAKAGGEHGVMTILESGEAFVCDIVPFGRVWRAGSHAAVEKLRAAQGKQDS